MTDVGQKTPTKKGDGHKTKASGKTWDEMTPAEKNQEEKERVELQPPPEPGRVKMFFSKANNSLWALNKQGHYQQMPERAANIMLKRAGYSDTIRLGDGTTFQEAEYCRIIEENAVDYAGSLGGFNTGIMEYNGRRILVADSPTIIKSEERDWPTLRNFIGQLLLDEAEYFYGWIKQSRRSLLAGIPWSIGQMLVLAGPQGCGKSVLQSLITPMLGGRASSPYKYMEGSTDFNAEIYSAEHGLIGDQNHKMTKGSRRAFGAAIKELCANPEQFMHGKHKTGCTVSAFLRLSMSVNDDPYALQVLPELESNVRDKLIVLQANRTNMPFPSAEFPSMHDYSRALKAEIPGMLWDLEKWEIPQEMRCQRYGIISFVSPSVLMKMASLSDEWKFWNFVEMYLFTDRLADEWTGTATQLEKRLRDEVKGDSLASLFYYPGACGQYLTSLASKMTNRILVIEKSDNRNVYQIRKNAPPS